MADQPDKVIFYTDSAGEVRWHRRDGYNNEIVAESGEGYVNVADAEIIARRVNGGDFVLITTVRGHVIEG